MENKTLKKLLKIYSNSTTKCETAWEAEDEILSSFAALSAALAVAQAEIAALNRALKKAFYPRYPSDIAKAMLDGHIAQARAEEADCEKLEAK